MAHYVSRSGLTHPAQIDALKVAFSAKDCKLEEWKGDMVVVGVMEKDMAKVDNSSFQNSILKMLDSKLSGLLSQASSEEDFTGKVGQSITLRISGLGSKRIGLVGLGHGLPASYRSLGEAVASAAKSSHATCVAIALASSEGISAEAKLNAAATITNGTMMGTFEDLRFKSESKKLALKSVDIIGLGTGPELEKKIKYAEDVCAGIIFGSQCTHPWGTGRRGCKDCKIVRRCSFFKKFGRRAVQRIENGFLSWSCCSLCKPSSFYSFMLQASKWTCQNQAGFSRERTDF